MTPLSNVVPDEVKERRDAGMMWPNHNFVEKSTAALESPISCSKQTRLHLIDLCWPSAVFQLSAFSFLVERI